LGCQFVQTITITAYGAPGINFFAISVDGRPETDMQPVGGSVFYPHIEGNCDEQVHSLRLNFYQNDKDWTESAWLEMKAKCGICSGICPQ
jgi:hypothetical protein